MDDECCALLCLIRKKSQTFGVHVMIEASANTCTQNQCEVSTEVFTESSIMKRKKVQIDMIASHILH